MNTRRSLVSVNRKLQAELDALTPILTGRTSMIERRMTPTPGPRHRLAGDFRGLRPASNPAPPSNWGGPHQARAPQFQPWSNPSGSPPPRMRNGLYGTVVRPPRAGLNPNCPFEGSPAPVARALPIASSIPSIGPNAFMKWIVDGWDTDGDGYINAAELAAGEVIERMHRQEGNFREGYKGGI